MPIKECGWVDWKRQHPERHAASKRLNQERRVAAKQLYVDDYLSSHPCIDCGISELCVLDFDHVRGEKTCDIRALVKGWASLARLKVEIAKCDVRCANDHRRRHSRIGGELSARGIFSVAGKPGEK